MTTSDEYLMARNKYCGKLYLISIIEEEQHVGIIEMELSQLTLLTYRN